MMEDILDVTLIDSYGHIKAYIEEFYKSFISNIEIYKSINEDVVDTLFSMVDFGKFKSSIIEYKKGFKHYSIDKVNKENKDQISGKQGFEYKEFLVEL